MYVGQSQEKRKECIHLQIHHTFYIKVYILKQVKQQTVEHNYKGQTQGTGDLGGFKSLIRTTIRKKIKTKGECFHYN